MKTLPANILALVNALEQTSARVASSGDSDGSQYLKMDKTGAWVFGADELDVEEGVLFAVNPNSFSTGFIAWDDGSPLDEAMALITEPAVIYSALAVHTGVKWDAQIGFQLKCLSGLDEGTELLYKSTSKGGKSAFKELVNAVLTRAKAGETEIVPVVELLSSSYKHKKYGKIFTPVISVVRWMGMDGTPAEVEPEVEPEPELIEAPAKKAAEKLAEKPAKKAPRSRRSRRSA